MQLVQNLVPALMAPHHVQLNASKGPEGLKEVRQAYQYTLDRMGQHAASGQLWQEYLAFLKAPQPGTPAFEGMYGGAGAGQEAGHRMAVLRSAQLLSGLHPHCMLQ